MYIIRLFSDDSDLLLLAERPKQSLCISYLRSVPRMSLYGTQANAAIVFPIRNDKKTFRCVRSSVRIYRLVRSHVAFVRQLEDPSLAFPFHDLRQYSGALFRVRSIDQFPAQKLLVESVVEREANRY